ncbi:MAG: hypothetical protein Fur002_01640 [Anaerolineales bacterium]
MQPIPLQRVVVIGVTSSGKSTFAQRLADVIRGDFIELDALHWEANWREAPEDLFRQRALNAVQAERWAAAGNYHVVRDILWKRADAIIWLNYPLRVAFWRMLTRTLSRAITQEELWNGNRENFWVHLKLWSPDSLFHWLFKTYWRRKREYPLLFRQPEYAHLKVITFYNPQEAEAWLQKIQAGGSL